MLHGLCLIALLSLQGGPDKSIFSDVIGTPSGKNGYEEYVAAADLMRGWEAEAYLGWSPLIPVNESEIVEKDLTALDKARLALHRRLDKGDLIAMQREFVDRFDDAIPLVLAGNEKSVRYPATVFNARTTMPEVTLFSRLAKLMLADANVKYSNGLSAAGTRRLCDVMTFGRNVQVGMVINGLVGISISARSMAAFEDRLGQLTPQDLLYVRDKTAALLARPLPLGDILEGEKKLFHGVFAEMETSAVKAFRESETYEVDPLSSEADFDKLPAAQRNEVLRTMKFRIERTGAVWDEVARRKEADLQKDAPFDDYDDVKYSDRPNSVAEFIAYFSPKFDLTYVGNASLKALVRNRAQLRLLLLHTYILSYKWAVGSLPKTLKDAAPAQLRRDIFSGEAFQYELRWPSGYRLYSKGDKATGELDLRYRKKPKEEGEVGESEYEPPQ